MDLLQEIQQTSEDLFDDIVAMRQHFHRFPELSFEEFKTSAYIQEQLRILGISFETGYAKTGIVATIKGKNPDKRIVALRADMDALPIAEKNDIAFVSENPGKMHACGHDLHMAALIGVAMILNKLKDDFEGTVLLVFQPAEEKLPGGANLMLCDGAFKGREPYIIIGQHSLPGIQSGLVGYKPGIYMASSDELYLHIKGRGGHAATPHNLVDPVLIAAHIIVGLQQIISRNADAAIPSVLSFGKIDAQGATNVIPSEVHVEGTFRTMNEEWRSEAHEKIQSLAKSTAEGMGGNCDVEIIKGYPVLENHVQYTMKAAHYSKQLLGNDKVVNLDLRMTSEDFACYAQQFPAVFYRFGTTDKANLYSEPLHSANFMADEQSLKTAMANLSWLAISFLSDK